MYQRKMDQVPATAVTEDVVAAKSQLNLKRVKVLTGRSKKRERKLPSLLIPYGADSYFLCI